MDEMGCWSLFPSLLGRHRPGASGRRQGTFTKESLPSKPIMQYHSCQIIVENVPSPSLSKRAKASLNSATCSSVSSGMDILVDYERLMSRN